MKAHRVNQLKFAAAFQIALKNYANETFLKIISQNFRKTKIYFGLKVFPFFAGGIDGLMMTANKERVFKEYKMANEEIKGDRISYLGWDLTLALITTRGS